jgi:hypothetical protein
MINIYKIDVARYNYPNHRSMKHSKTILLFLEYVPLKQYNSVVIVLLL